MAKDKLLKELKTVEALKKELGLQADPPLDYKTIGELTSATFGDIATTSLVAVETSSGTQNLTIENLLKAIASLQEQSNSRNNWQQNIPIGALMPFGGANGTTQSQLGNYLPCNGQGVTKTQFPLLFDALGITDETYNLPNMNIQNGLFVRGIDLNITQPLQPQGDAIRNITGTFSTSLAQTGFIRTGNGVFKEDNVAEYSPSGREAGSGIAHTSINFDASTVVPTADENRPKNIGVVWYIKVDSQF